MRQKRWETAKTAETLLKKSGKPPKQQKRSQNGDLVGELGVLDVREALEERCEGVRGLQVRLERARAGRISLERERAGRIILERDQAGRISLERERAGRISLEKERAGRIGLERERAGRIRLERDQAGRITTEARPTPVQTSTFHIQVWFQIVYPDSKFRERDRT